MYLKIHALNKILKDFNYKGIRIYTHKNRNNIQRNKIGKIQKNESGLFNQYKRFINKGAFTNKEKETEYFNKMRNIHDKINKNIPGDITSMNDLKLYSFENHQ